MKPFRLQTIHLAFVFLAVMLSGCATPKIDWSARIGSYTYDQAVIELGPPDKDAKLGDGTLVAEWLTRRGYNQIHPTGAYYYGSPGYYGGFPPAYIETASPDYFLRLIFNPDGKLQSWKSYAR